MALPETITIARIGAEHRADHEAMHKRFNQVFDVTDSTYGAVGDGTTDDTAAIQAAIDAASTASGGVVFFPPGTYKIVKLASTNYALSVYGDNITFQGCGSVSILKTSSGTGNGFGFFCFGGGKVAGMPLWASNRYYDATQYAITPAARSALTVTTVVAANAGNFAADDFVYIRTGQCIDSSPGTDEPDSEINQVVSAVVGTGVITLRWPLAKPYAQEYYVTGTSDRTTTAVTANAAPLTIANVTDRTMINLAFCDLAIEDTTPEGFMAGGQLVGLLIDNVTGTFSGLCQNMGDYRRAIIKNNLVHGTGRGASVGYAAFSTSKGCTNVLFTGNLLSSDGTTSIHFAEGNAGVKVIDNTILSVPNTSADAPLAMNNRAYDFIVRGNTIINGGNNGAITVNTYSDGGGIITGNIIRGTNIGPSISVGAANWLVGDNYIEPGLIGPIQYSGGAKQPAEMKQLSGWVRFDRQNPALGTLSGRFYVTNVRVYVSQAFNSGGTDLITVGFDASAAAYAAAVDVSATGSKAVTLGGYVNYPDPANTVQVEAYYTAGGTAPTTGKALVIVEYFQVPEDQ